MKEYIERDKLIKAFEEQLKEHGDPDVMHQPVTYGGKLGIMYGLSIAQTLPAADVEKVVRCKDCCYCFRDKDGNFDPNNIFCGRHCDNGFTEHDFCSYGEREENGDE